MGYIGREAVVRAYGHPHLRATHAKTLELTRETSVTERATCVVGVGADFDPEELALLRGPVSLTLRAGDHEASGTAVINPGHEVCERIVLRRSGFRDADTLVTDATLAADDLPPALAAALAEPSTQVTLTIGEAARPAPLVFVGEPAGGRAKILWEHADQTVDLRAVPSEPVLSGIVAAGLPPGVEALPRKAVDWLIAAVAAGARIAVPGDPAAELLLAAGYQPEPSMRLGRLDKAAELPKAIPVPAIVALPADQLLNLHNRFAVPAGTPDLGTAMAWNDTEPGGEIVAVVVAPDEGDHVPLDAVVRALTDAGVPPRTIGEALKPFGITRRRLYGVRQ